MEPTQKQGTEKSRNKLDWLLQQGIDMKIDLIQNHLSICEILLNEMFEEEVIQKAGKRYSHNKPHDGRFSRWGFNPGSVKIGDQRLKMEIPRIHDNKHNTFESLSSYEKVKENEAPTEQLIKGVLLGLSMRDYEGVIDHLGESFGLSKSSISRSFKERTQKRLEEFEQRDLSNHDFVGLFIDGKYLAGEQIMIVLGVSSQGEKIPLGFLQTHSENSVPIADLFRQLISRGLKYEEGLLFVIDGAKGIKKAIKEVFQDKAVIQRCSWHKRENVKKYLNQNDQEWFETKYYTALSYVDHEEARAELKNLTKELKKINVSAARSLEEGREELLTLHKLGMYIQFKRSFHTTNAIENLNSQLGKYIGKVKHWKNSEMRYRWIASGLMEIEQKMRRISNYKNLYKLKEQIKIYISESSQSESQVSTKNGT